MAQAKIDPLWGQACQAIQLQALPTDQNLSSLTALQDRIEHDLGRKLQRIPRQSLHCTILTLLPPSKVFDKPKFEIWAEHAETWTAAVAAVVSKAEPFELRFTRVEVSELAVIVRAEVPPVLERIRRRMAGAIGYHDWQPRPPDIAHITMFRYRESGPLPQPQDFEWNVDVTMQVSTLRLIKETVYPTLESEPLCWLPLSSGVEQSV